jgi:hypothetical protein
VPAATKSAQRPAAGHAGARLHSAQMAQQWPKVVSHVPTHDFFKRDPALQRNSKTTKPTIPTASHYATKPSETLVFTTGRSLRRPALVDAAAAGIG